MSDDFDKRVHDLEEALANTETALRQEGQMPKEKEPAGGPTCIPYVYIISAIVPLLTLAVLYFIKPKFVTKKKTVIATKSLLMWTAIITGVAWIALFGANYYGAFGDAALCLGGKK